MSREKLVGTALMAVGLAVILVYAWLLFAPPRPGIDTTLLKVTVFAIVAAVGALLAWIGYALATAPPPKPIEEIEKELEEELKRLEEELKSRSEGEEGSGS